MSRYPQISCAPPVKGSLVLSNAVSQARGYLLGLTPSPHTAPEPQDLHVQLAWLRAPCCPNSPCRHNQTSTLKLIPPTVHSSVGAVMVRQLGIPKGEIRVCGVFFLTIKGGVIFLMLKITNTTMQGDKTMFCASMDGL